MKPDYKLKLMKEPQSKKAIGFHIFVSNQEVAQILFFPGRMVPSTCMLQHKGEKLLCKDRIEALEVLTHRLKNET